MEHDEDYTGPARHMIGVQTTLPGRGRARKHNPIGFIWPALEQRASGRRTKKGRRQC
jgi:hypothetical protein